MHNSVFLPLEIFISHHSSQKNTAHTVKALFEDLGHSAFVAHDDAESQSFRQSDDLIEYLQLMTEFDTQDHVAVARDIP